MLQADRTDAHRVLGVLDAGLQSLQLLAAIPEPCTSDEEERQLLARLEAQGLGHLIAPLRQQWQRERALTAVEGGDAAAPAHPTFAALRPQQRRLMQQATRHLARELVLRSQASTTSVLHDALADAAAASTTATPVPSESLALLLGMLGELKSILSRRFRSTLKQDMHAATLLGETTEKHRVVQEAFDALSLTYEGGCMEKQRETVALEALQRRLEGELAEWTAKTAAEMAAVTSEMEGSVREAHEGHKRRKAELTQEMAALLPEMNRFAQGYKAEAAALQAQQAAAEAELAALLQQYDGELQAKQEGLDALRATAAAEAAELAQLRAHFAVVDAQQAELQRMEAERLRALEEKQRREAEDLRRMVQCAVRVQAIYRGWRAWVAFHKQPVGSAAGGEKDKAKGGKGGKGGKKKGDGEGKAKKEDKPSSAAGGKKPAGAAAAAPKKKK